MCMRGGGSGNPTSDNGVHDGKNYETENKRTRNDEYEKKPPKPLFLFMIKRKEAKENCITLEESGSTGSLVLKTPLQVLLKTFWQRLIILFPSSVLSRVLIF